VLYELRDSSDLAVVLMVPRGNFFRIIVTTQLTSEIHPLYVQNGHLLISFPRATTSQSRI